jgi:hypothetical protein
MPVVEIGARHQPSAPFRLDLTVWALRRRPHNEVDRWDSSGTYGRVLSLDGRPVSLGAQNKLKRLLAIDTPLGYEDVRTLVARWHPFAGVVYFHLLLDSLSRSKDGPRLVGRGIGAGKTPAVVDAV